MPSDDQKKIYASRPGIADSVEISDGNAAIIGTDPSCRIMIDGASVGLQHAILKIVDNEPTVVHNTTSPAKVTTVLDRDGNQLDELNVDGSKSRVVEDSMRIRIGVHEILITDSPVGVRNTGEFSSLNLELLEDQGDQPAQSSLNLSNSNDRKTHGQISLYMNTANAAHKGKSFPESATFALGALREQLPHTLRGAVLLITDNGLESVADWSQSGADGQKISISRSLLAQAAGGEAVVSDDAGAGGTEQSLLNLAGTSVMLVPILAGNGKTDPAAAKVIGYLQLEASTDAPYTKDDLPLGHTASTILGAKLYEFESMKGKETAANLQGALDATQKELAQAGSMQRNVMGSRNQIEGFSTTELYEPSQSTSGDWTVSEKAPDGTLFRILGDIAGHGDSISHGATALAFLARSLIVAGNTPLEIIKVLNKQIQDNFPAGRFSTFTMYIIEPNTDKVTRYAVGGMRPLIVGANGEVRRPSGSEAGSAPMGILDYDILSNDIEPLEIQLAPGDTIIDMTDGIPETFRELRDGDEKVGTGDKDDISDEAFDTQNFEFGRIIHTISTARKSAPAEASNDEIAKLISSALLKASRDFQDNRPRGEPDDITIMITMRDEA